MHFNSCLKYRRKLAKQIRKEQTRKERDSKKKKKRKKRKHKDRKHESSSGSEEESNESENDNDKKGMVVISSGFIMICSHIRLSYSNCLNKINYIITK